MKIKYTSLETLRKRSLRRLQESVYRRPQSIMCHSCGRCQLTEAITRWDVLPRGPGSRLGFSTSLSILIVSSPSRNLLIFTSPYTVVVILSLMLNRPITGAAGGANVSKGRCSYSVTAKAQILENTPITMTPSCGRFPSSHRSFCAVSLAQDVSVTSYKPMSL